MRWEYLTDGAEVAAAAGATAQRACIAVFTKREFDRVTARALARQASRATESQPAQQACPPT
jgi:hypothetical protein